jgi:hypothetical protein
MTCETEYELNSMEVSSDTFVDEFEHEEQDAVEGR